MSTNLTNSIRKENEDQQNTSSNVVKTGYLRKLKTMKKKYFVLLNDSNDGFARVEYYDSEKKFKTNSVQPKRSIVLKTCFSISKKVDAKHKYAIALYTKEDCFFIVYDDEEQMNDWLKVMVDLQSQSQNNDSKQRLRKSIDYIWQVNILKNGLGQAINMIGVYRLCLTSQSIYLVKMNCEIEDVEGSSEIPLISIRRLAHASNVGALMIELGRSAPFGPGELWIQAEDSTVAHHMHEVIIKAMKATTVNEEFGTSHMRPRSASTSENSKPIAHRRPQNVQLHPSKSLKQPNVGSSMTGQSNLTSYSSIRERCDSMPSSSRNKIDNDKAQDISHRPHQISYHNRTQSYSPPSQNPLSPSSCACSTDSAGSSLSIDENENADYFIVHHNVPLEPSIKEEEQIDENHYFVMNPSKHSIQQTDIRATVNITQSIFHDAKNKSDESGYLLMDSGLNNQTKNFHDENNENSPNLTSEYVDMIPSNRKEKSNREDDFYDFTPMSSSLPKSHDLTLSSSFQQQLENSLEKVKSYFDKKADEPMDYIKPVRAYSIGSRPQQQSTFSKKVYLNPNQKPNSSETDYLMTSFGSITGKKEDFHLQQVRTRAHTYGQDAKLLRARIAAQKKASAQNQISKSNSNSLNETPEHLSLSSDSFTLTPVFRNRSSTIGSRPIEKPIAENVSPQNQTSSSESETASSSGLFSSNTSASAESSSNTVQSASPTGSSSSNLNSSSQDYVEICPKNISHNVSYAEIEFNNSTKIDSTRK